jgi:hypothetical protein
MCENGKNDVVKFNFIFPSLEGKLVKLKNSRSIYSSLVSGPYIMARLRQKKNEEKKIGERNNFILKNRPRIMVCAVVLVDYAQSFLGLHMEFCWTKDLGCYVVMKNIDVRI